MMAYKSFEISKTQDPEIVGPISNLEIKDIDMGDLLHFLMREYPDYYYLRGRKLQQLPEITHKEVLDILKAEFVK